MTEESAVVAALDEVIDPELNIDVNKLGMVGPIAIEGGHVTVKMRLTSMSCPFWELFIAQVESAVAAVEGVERVSVMFDDTAEWSPEMMTPEARRQLEAVGLMPLTRRRGGKPQPAAGELLQITNAVLGSPLKKDKP